MKLYVEHNGELVLVEDHLEEFNLERNVARSHIIEGIKDVIEKIKTNSDPWED